MQSADEFVGFIWISPDSGNRCHEQLARDGGRVSGLMASLAGLQQGNALILFVTGDNTIPFHCALARLAFNHGTVAFDKTLLDTQKSMLHVEGQADLKTRAIDVKVTAGPKDFDLLDPHAPVVIKGTMSKPKISIDRDMPIPTPEFGGAKDVACEQMTEERLAGKAAPAN
jgi:hypothetical protein